MTRGHTAQDLDPRWGPFELELSQGHKATTHMVWIQDGVQSVTKPVMTNGITAQGLDPRLIHLELSNDAQHYRTRTCIQSGA